VELGSHLSISDFASRMQFSHDLSRIFSGMADSFGTQDIWAS
jgi:hypothetical protein